MRYFNKDMFGIVNNELSEMSLVLDYSYQIDKICSRPDIEPYAITLIRKQTYNLGFLFLSFLLYRNRAFIKMKIL